MKNAFRTALLSLALLASPALAQAPTTEWDGLVKVPSTRFDAVFLAPGADFSAYTKVMLDPTEAAFRQNWQRDFNRTTTGLQNRISDRDAQQILQAVQSGLQDVFTEEYRRAGFEVVTTPGPDVLRVRTGVANLVVTAPDRMTAGRTRTFSGDAGEATLVIEARDSMSGALLGRGVDRRRIDDNSFMVRRTSVSNRSDFGRTFRTWAQQSANALSRLRSEQAPVVGAAGGASAQN